MLENLSLNIIVDHSLALVFFQKKKKKKTKIRRAIMEQKYNTRSMNIYLWEYI